MHQNRLYTRYDRMCSTKVEHLLRLFNVANHWNLAFLVPHSSTSQYLGHTIQLKQKKREYRLKPLLALYRILFSSLPRRKQNYRFEYCGRFRALCRPYFLRSTSRASLVRNPARLSGARFSSAT